MGTKSIFIPKAVTDRVLGKPPLQGKHFISSFGKLFEASGVPQGAQGAIEILENHEVERFGNQTEVHRTAADLWVGISGSITFVVGGEVVEPRERVGADGSVNPNEIRGKAITNGAEYAVGPGDIFYIPPGEPHTHYGSGRAFIVKLDV